MIILESPHDYPRITSGLSYYHLAIISWLS